MSGVASGPASGPDGVGHLAALRTEGDRLVAAVRAADLDAAVPGLQWDVRTVAVHTGAVHRWAADVEAAGGAVRPVAADLAQDGLVELVGGFATEAGFATDRPGVLLLAPDDGPAWRVQLGDGPNRVTTGPGSDLAVVAFWRQVRIT